MSPDRRGPYARTRNYLEFASLLNGLAWATVNAAAHAYHYF